MQFRWLLFGIFIASLTLLLLAITPGPFQEDKIILIKRGSLFEVATQLEQENTVVSKYVFFPVAKCFNVFNTLKAGEYQIPASSSVLDIISKMQIGDYVKRAITIPEGLMTSQIFEIVETNIYLSGQINKANYKEGSLLPETYLFTRGESRTNLLNRMSRDLQEALDAAWNDRDQDLPFNSKDELLNLASIVEKEAKFDEERPKIASVFINRLKKKMKLEADPTTIYAITGGQYTLDRSLRRADLKLNSPFNTYVNCGLPPTPVANPGIRSLMAVAHPDHGNNLYFVVKDCNGRHNFSNNIKDHAANVRLYRKLICKQENV